jgi:hypothetical protein
MFWWKKTRGKIYHVRVSLTLNQPGSGKSVNYRGPFAFGLAFTRCKLTSSGNWVLCIERCGFGYLPRTVRRAATLIGPLWKSERLARLRTRHPPHSTRPGTWNSSEFYWRHTSLRTTARRDFSRARVVRNSCKTGRKQGCRQSSDATEFLMKKRQNGRQNVVFWCHVRSSKRFGRRFCKNRSKKYNLIYKNIVRNLTSKLARSTLTSPGWIRVKSRCN